jgi:hypothetical protein
MSCTLEFFLLKTLISQQKKPFWVKNIKKMLEENENNDGTWSGLKKTIIGLITTLVTAGAAYVTSTLFGGGNSDDSKVEQVIVAPTPAPIINLNVDNSSQNNSSGGGTTTIIREIERPSSQPSKPKTEEEDPW